MVDLSRTIIAKSDQLNADDLLGGPITVKIEAVKEGNADQPIAIFYEGCTGKPFYPCKSMRRILVNVWGKDGNSYVGKSLTLYRDPAVKFGGIAVGGIRISHMSGLEKDMPMALQVTKGSKKLFTVKPLRIQQPQPQPQPQPQQTDDRAGAWVTAQVAAIAKAQSLDELQQITAAETYGKYVKRLTDINHPRLLELQEAASKRAQDMTEDEFPRFDADTREGIPA